MKYIGSIEYDESLLVAKKIILFGAGQYSSLAFEYLEANNVSNKIIAICDNDKNKQGRSFYGVEIISVECAINEHRDAEFVIYGNNKDDMLNQLLLYGLDDIHFLIEY